MYWVSYEKKRIPNHVKFLISGLSGMGATMIVQPLDLLKVRMQLSGEGGASREHKTALHAIRSIVQTEGLLGLYAGISANLARQATYGSTRVASFQMFVEMLDKRGYSGLLPQMAAGCAAGGIAVTLATPTDVCLVRMMSDARLPPSERRNYRHVFDAYRTIWKAEGLTGLYVGYRTNLVRAIIGNMVQLVSYVQAKYFLINRGYMEDNTKCHFVSSFISGFLYSLASCPFDVLKTRMQQKKMDSGLPAYSSILDGWAKTVSKEGLPGLWKGLIPLYLRTAPHTILFFVFIEKLSGNFLSPQPRYLTDMDHRKKSGDKMWNGNSSNGVDKLTSTLTSSSSTPTSTSTNTENSSFYRCETRNEVTSSMFHTEQTTSQTKEVGGSGGAGSSFILQRVERLYGPGALAQGFYTRRSLNFSTPPPNQPKEEEEEVTESNKESPLPVLRLLRPEFRAQLSLAKRKSSSPICSPNRPSDSVDGAVERIIPIVVEGNKSSNCKTIEERETAEMPVSSKDGHYYLKMVVEETERLERLAAELDADLESAPEHMEGRLRAAAGKGRLLATQKLAQFKGLCHKNLIQDTSEDFPTTCEDLAGFWDMVYIQVASIHEEFAQIAALRKAGWPEQEEVDKEGAKKSGSRRVKSGVAAAPAPPQPAPAKSNLTKARDEARKRMLAERRRQMRNTSNTNDDVVLV